MVYLVKGFQFPFVRSLSLLSCVCVMFSFCSPGLAAKTSTLVFDLFNKVSFFFIYYLFILFFFFTSTCFSPFSLGFGAFIQATVTVIINVVLKYTFIYYIDLNIQRKSLIYIYMNLYVKVYVRNDKKANKLKNKSSVCCYICLHPTITW